MASDAGLYGFDDLRQDIWVKFLRYKPKTTTGAWKMAHCVAIDFARRAQTRQRLYQKMRHQTGTAELDTTGLRFWEMRQLRPRALAYAIGHSGRKNNGAEKRMLHYYRQQLRALA